MVENTIERILEICKEKNIPVSRIEKDLGFGNGSLNSDKAKDIKSSRLFAVLNYLGVSFEEFYRIPASAPEETKNPATNGDGDDELTNYIVNIIKGLPIEYKIRAVNELQSLQQELQGQDSSPGSV